MPDLKTFVPRSAERDVQRAFELLLDDLRMLKGLVGGSTTTATSKASSAATPASVADIDNVVIQNADPGPVTVPTLWIIPGDDPPYSIRVVLRSPPASDYAIPATAPPSPVVLQEDGGGDEQMFIVQRFIEAAPPQVVMMLGNDGEDGEPGFSVPAVQQSVTIVQMVMYGNDGEDGEAGLVIPGKDGVSASTITQMVMFSNDGEDGEPGMPIPGPAGAAGTSSGTATPGPPGMDASGDDVDPVVPFYPPADPSRAFAFFMG